MDRIYRVFIEKKAGFDNEAIQLKNTIHSFLGITALSDLRIAYRYDVSGVSQKEYQLAKETVLSDPPQDIIYEEEIPITENDIGFAIEYLPGQYDQRSDAAAQCIQILSQKNPPIVRHAKLIILNGTLTKKEVETIKNFCVNPVDSRLAALEKPLSLKQETTSPPNVQTIDGFIQLSDVDRNALLGTMGLAMHVDDLAHCQTYFKEIEKRDPTITEIKMLDTYWSDHCRHTTFLTEIEEVKIQDSPYSEIISHTYNHYKNTHQQYYKGKERPDCLMDLATIAMKAFRKKGWLKELDLSEEINACSIKIPVKEEKTGNVEDWLIMFKNETHNHPTEIEPFGGAATCLGGAIRDPLSGRSYVYQAMRVTGSGDPRKTPEETLKGKLPQRTITTQAAKGYSSYGNQIGLATGKVSEIYHEGYVAKRMEIGAVVGAVPAKNVVRTTPEKGDIVLLIGGRTGRDGVGGATGSSKVHTETALKNEAEVQKGNPPVERKLQRLFTDPILAPKIKRCNDFGAGGVSVAVGELTESLDIFLDNIPKKYEGLDGTELALSESQERMALVIESADFELFKNKAKDENLEATHVANVTETGRLRMYWRDSAIVDLARSFLDTNGIRQKTKVEIEAVKKEGYFNKKKSIDDFKTYLETKFANIHNAGLRGLIDQFDSTIGARSVLHPFGGKYLATESDAMVSKLPFIESDIATNMSWGFNPRLSEWSPFHGAVYAVVESVAKNVAVGADYRKTYLTFQEYFERLGTDPQKWGKPYAALLGAYYAQNAFKIAAIGGKDSMSGTFKQLNVPPTLVSFALTPGSAKNSISAEFKKSGSAIYLLETTRDENDLPDFEPLLKGYNAIHTLIGKNHILAAKVVEESGLAVTLAKMSFGNRIGCTINEGLNKEKLFIDSPGSIIVEVEKGALTAQKAKEFGFKLIAHTTAKSTIRLANEEVDLKHLQQIWEEPLQNVFPTEHNETYVSNYKNVAQAKTINLNLGLKPRVFIPVFPGTNCEYDSIQAFENAGAHVSSLVLNNMSPELLNSSISAFEKELNMAHILMLPGGFSSGDEPEGSGKFIATVFRNKLLQNAVDNLLNKRKGLILGICNGFQALVKLGLLPFGEIEKADSQKSPTLAFNKLKKHYSTYVHTKVLNNHSPWLQLTTPGMIHNIPISNGEGRFMAPEKTIEALFKNGQIATQYVDLNGNPSIDARFNPSSSLYAIEGIASPDGRVLGKMGHSERIGKNVAKNILGEKDQKIFEAGVNYFK